MQGLRIKITGPDGRSWTVPLAGAQLRFGRSPDSDVTLDAGGVSSHHCVIGRDPSGALFVQDQGSTNGTWIGQQRVQGAVALHPGVVLTVGSYLVALDVAPPAGGHRPMTGAAPIVAPPIPGGARGPLIRKSEDQHRDRRLRVRIRRYADEWDKAGRPGRLLLRGRNLRQAVDLLELTADPDDVFSELEESFVRASKEGHERGKVVRLVAIGGGALAAIGLVVALAIHDWGGAEVVVADSEGQTGETGGTEGGADTGTVKKLEGPGVVDRTAKRRINHVVVPEETLDDIAKRYDVSLRILATENSVDENSPLDPGRTLAVHTAMDPLPLAQQNITYTTDQPESWSSLSKRFDVPVAKLQAYNAKVPDKIKKGTELSIWIDPKPLTRKADAQMPEFTVRQDAISIGAPQNGKIDNAIRFPKNDALYRRRNPQIMWCASPMAQHLQWAVAKFRYTYEFEGEMVIADMSRKRGGLFDPHKSHQAGRDVDIWLPTLKGVYQESHIREGKERRPYPGEADWFALYGFVKALGETNAVESVFLDKTLHDRVYNAALLMGADETELEDMIMFHPDGGRYPHALLKHAAEHTRHVHVRFKCGPNDQCSKSLDAGPGD